MIFFSVDWQTFLGFGMTSNSRDTSPLNFTHNIAVQSIQSIKIITCKK